MKKASSSHWIGARFQGGWVHVKVLDAPNKGKLGYVSVAAVNEFQLRSFSFGHGKTSFTGVTYGSDVVTWDGQDDITIWKDNCPYCGADRQSHRIVESRTGRPPDPQYRRGALATGSLHQEGSYRHWMKPSDWKGDPINNPRTVGTDHDALILYEALAVAAGHLSSSDFQSLIGKSTKDGMATKKSWGANTAGTMLGVLHVADTNDVYAAHSGPERFGFADVCLELGFKPCPLKFRGKIRNRAPMPYHVAPDFVQTMKSELTCAAPRLIQEAIYDGQYPVAMTEIWYQPGDTHEKYPNKHTIESCDRCRKTVPLMLCPQ